MMIIIDKQRTCICRYDFSLLEILLQSVPSSLIAAFAALALNSNKEHYFEFIWNLESIKSVLNQRLQSHSMFDLVSQTPCYSI